MKANIYKLKNSAGMEVLISDFGASIQSLFVPDKSGNVYDVVLGYDGPDNYKRSGGTFFGTTVGRNANRIGKASFLLNGATVSLEQNDNENNLHSGTNSYSFRTWNIKNVSENSIMLSMDSPDGDQGFPGNAKIEVTYTLTEDNEVKIEYYGIADQDTVFNLTNHSYFNLNGHTSGSILEHKMWIDADSYTEIDGKSIPTGKILSVMDTEMDFRNCTKIQNEYDHNWCLNNHGKFAKVASLLSDESGIQMDVYTDLPGVQVYTANYVIDEHGKNGAVYQKHQGVCFETQYYPDAVNHQHFPSPVVKKGEEYHTVTVYKFIW